MRAQETNGARPPGGELWRRSQEIEASPDEAERFLELAGFAEDRLDDDDTARIAALIALDADAAGDLAAARALADAAAAPADEHIISRAAALVGGGASPGAEVIAFPPRPRLVARPWFGAATWSGLAAAIAFAGWLGFDLGSGLSSSPSLSRPSDDQSASEFFDPAPLLLRDFTDNSRI